MIVGVEYANTLYGPREHGGSGLEPPPAAFRGVARAIKITDVLWRDCEPPRAWWQFFAPRYDWTRLDALIAAWEAAGYDDIGMVVRAVHPSYCAATVYPPREWAARTLAASSPPKPGELARYGDWLGELASRYRGRVGWYEIESEQQDVSHWLGTADDYLVVLETAWRAIRRADPAARVVLGGHTFGDLLDDDPSEQEALRRLLALPEPERTWMLRARDVLEAGLSSPYYHAAEFHALSGASGVEPAARWTRARTAGRPVWMGDATSAPHVVPGIHTHRRWTAPTDLWGALYEWARWTGLERGDAAVVAEHRAAQAALTRAKLDAARAAGCERAFVGTLGDWPMVSGFPHGGLADRDGRLRPVADVIRAAQNLGTSTASAEVSGGGA